MSDGGAVWNVATWHRLIEGINGMTLGFPAAFQFPWVFSFKNFSHSGFSFLSYSEHLSLLLRFCHHSVLIPVTLDLASTTNFSGFNCSAFQGTLLLRFLRFFSS